MTRFRPRNCGLDTIVGKVEQKVARFLSRRVEAATVLTQCNTDNGCGSGSGMEESPRLRGDSEEGLEDEFEPPPTFKYHSYSAPRSPYPSSFQNLGREDGPPAAPDLDLATRISLCAWLRYLRDPCSAPNTHALY